MKWLRRLIMGDPPNPQTPELDRRSQMVVDRIAKRRGITPQEVRDRARRRAMEIEVRSYRSGH